MCGDKLKNACVFQFVTSMDGRGRERWKVWGVKEVVLSRRFFRAGSICKQDMA